MPIIVRSGNRAYCDSYLGLNSCDLTDDEFTALRADVYRWAAQSTQSEIIYEVHDALLPRFGGAKLPFPRELIRQVIYLVRDPRDVARTLARTSRRDLDYIIRRMNDENWVIAGNKKKGRLEVPQLVGRWSDHAESWLGAGEMNLSLLKFEDYSRWTGEEASIAHSLLGKMQVSCREEVADDNRNADEPAQSVPIGRGDGVAALGTTASRLTQADLLSEAQAVRILTDHRRTMSKLGYRV